MASTKHVWPVPSMRPVPPRPSGGVNGTWRLVRSPSTADAFVICDIDAVGGWHTIPGDEGMERPRRRRGVRAGQQLPHPKYLSRVALTTGCGSAPSAAPRPLRTEVTGSRSTASTSTGASSPTHGPPWQRTRPLPPRLRSLVGACRAGGGLICRLGAARVGPSWVWSSARPCRSTTLVFAGVAASQAASPIGPTATVVFTVVNF